VTCRHCGRPSPRVGVCGCPAAVNARRERRIEIDLGKLPPAEGRQMIMVHQDGRLSSLGLDSIRGRTR